MNDPIYAVRVDVLTAATVASKIRGPIDALGIMTVLTHDEADEPLCEQSCTASLVSFSTLSHAGVSAY